MDHRKHPETFGPFAGLWVRTARALRKAGYQSREQVHADIKRGVLHPFISIFDYGKYADAEVRTWLDLKIDRAVARPGRVGKAGAIEMRRCGRRVR